MEGCIGHNRRFKQKIRLRKHTENYMRQIIIIFRTYDRLQGERKVKTSYVKYIEIFLCQTHQLHIKRGVVKVAF